MSHRENIRWMLLVPIPYVVPLLRQSRKLQPQWLTRSCGLLNSPCVDIPCSKQFYSKIQKITTKFQETRFIKKNLETKHYETFSVQICRNSTFHYFISRLGINASKLFIALLIISNLEVKFESLSFRKDIPPNENFWFERS